MNGITSILHLYISFSQFDMEENNFKPALYVKRIRQVAFLGE